MLSPSSSINRQILVAVLSAIAGGLVVALATEAIPKMMARTMAGFMQRMMAQQGANGCSPSAM